MSGISLLMSKSCCPMYSFGASNTISFGTNNKISFGASNKMDLVSHRLSNLHLQRISPTVASRCILKPRAYSSFDGKYVTGLRSEVPEVTGAVVSYVVVGVGIVGMALHKAREVVVQFISTRGRIVGVLCMLLGYATVSVARGILGDIVYGFAVREVKGQVIEMGLETTSWIHAENNLVAYSRTSWFYGQAIKNKSRATTVVPYSLLCGKDVMNKSQVPYHAMVSKVYFHIDEIMKTVEILEDITNMMKSNSNVYLGECQPYCHIDHISGYMGIRLGYNLKQVSEHQLYLAKQDVLLKSAQIIKKHGATVGGDHNGN